MVSKHAFSSNTLEPALDHGGPARNLVAPRPKLPPSNGPSNGPTRHASKASASASQPRPAKGLMRVKRTRVEKDRLRTGLSSSEEPEGPRNTVASLPSASAPVPNKAAFNRDALQHRFSMVGLSVPSATAPVKGKAKTVPTEIIEIVDSDEEPTPSKLKSKPFVPSNKPKFVASRSNKEIIAISSDESDGPPSRKSVPQKVVRVGIPSSLAPTDADATPPIQVEPHRASTVLRDATPPPTPGRGTQGIPSSSPRLHSKPNGLLPSLEDNTAVQPLDSPFILRDEGPSGATPSPNPPPSLTHSPSMSPPPPEESISAPPSPPTRSPSRRSSTRVAFPLLDLRTVSSSAPRGAWKPRLQTARTAPLPSTNPKLSSPPPNVKQSRKSVNIPVSLPKRTASPPSSPPERSREPASPPSRPRSRLKSENTDATLSSMPAIIDLTLDDTPPSSPPATMEEIHPLSKEGLLRRFVDRISSIRGVNKVQTMSGDAHAAPMSPDDPPSLDTQREENYPHSNDQGLLRSFADRISGIRGVNKAQTMSNDAASVNLDDPSQQMLESALDTELIEPEDIDGPQPVDTRMLSPETSAAQEKYSAQMGILHSGRLRQAYAQSILSRHRLPSSEEEEIGQDLIPSPIQQREEAMQLHIGNEFEQTQPSASDTEVVPAASRASPAPDGSPHLPNLAAMDISSSLGELRRH
ncbi:hypothetical protein C8F01DRAFT_121019 [Mycena amicta]|nr:hypothetical protein C8F01DRAFT_121019 [Mycena amicta]